MNFVVYSLLSNFRVGMVQKLPRKFATVGRVNALETWISLKCSLNVE